MGRTINSPTPPVIAKASTCASKGPPRPATAAATSAAAASNPNARVSVKYSATPKTTAAINHTTHSPRNPEFVSFPIGVLVAEVNLHPHNSLAEAGQGLENLVPHALHEI